MKRIVISICQLNLNATKQPSIVEIWSYTKEVLVNSFKKAWKEWSSPSAVFAIIGADAKPSLSCQESIYLEIPNFYPFT
jgi:hypothetical protein